MATVADKRPDNDESGFGTSSELRRQPGDFEVEAPGEAVPEAEPSYRRRGHYGSRSRVAPAVAVLVIVALVALILYFVLR